MFRATFRLRGENREEYAVFARSIPDLHPPKKRAKEFAHPNAVGGRIRRRWDGDAEQGGATNA
jgi:hypothetical protein